MKIIIDITIDQLEPFESVLHQAIQEEECNEEVDNDRVNNIKAILDNWKVYNE